MARSVQSRASCSMTEVSERTCQSCPPRTETLYKEPGGDLEQGGTTAWMAVEPPQTHPLTPESGILSRRRRPSIQDLQHDALNTTTPDANPPSFHASQFGIILRHQRLRPADNSGLKHASTFPSRFIHLSNAFEFAGWGSVTRLKLSTDDYAAGLVRIQEQRKEQVLGQFLASGLAGNAVLGSVFYALPAVVAVGGIYSPISLFIATLVLFLWRPIMEELASALPISGGPYTYILNVSTKSFALVGAALLLLDFASTSIVSAATAATYLGGEVPSLPFPVWVGGIIVLVLFTLVSLIGILSMLVLMIASVVHWGLTGNSQIKANWELGRASKGTSTSSVARQIYYGICLGMLGLTGFECTPSYVSRIKAGKFPLVLRNLHLPAIFLNTLMMLLVLALVPLDVILGGANVLSVLAQASGGRWLRTWIVVDAIVVLCGGVLTGILSACELLTQLATHRVLPQFFLHPLPFSPFALFSSNHPTPSQTPYIAILAFAAFCGMLFATAGASLDVISEMFSLVWLCVMALFPISLLLLKFNRGRLPRKGSAGVGVLVLAGLVVGSVGAGNIAYKPRTAGYFAAYFLGIITLFSATQNKVHLLRWVYWVYDQYPTLHNGRATRAWGGGLIRVMQSLRGQEVCILVKTDEINNLFHMIVYVCKNEETANLKIVHFYEDEKGIPSELEANAKILDEAFPEITIDLILVSGHFEPPSVAALSHHKRIPQALMFMTCPSVGCPYSIADFGTRIISL
ncbi:hypothetical protein BDN70DRAFT_891267 [Pholiota conissans]|uniref:Uncharacterized protein n=1 Tax=Pholiota conissans TaxID=109636 RepID=A0A9P6D5J6_9AGAR|nr:hypothetical protein BDN70DRAFT_891267 [Pholiota conissans]